jgi:2-oxo-4-hydroxy-4-carboxy-5-ureidoimidazoline decarboxylase
MTDSPARGGIAEINAMDQAGFLRLFGGVFEHSSWVAERAWAARPFASLGALHAAMVAAVRAATRDEQLALLRAHPELAGKEAEAGTMTGDSVAEQKGAGLVNLGADEKRRIGRLNAQYRTKFGFPFIIAVREHTKAGIFSEFERRLADDAETELATCLAQVFAIARLRLERLIDEPAGSMA